MINHKKHAYHFETSCLLPLKLALIEAEKESPPRPLKLQRDVNEELALKLIKNMKKKYERFVFKPLSFEMKCEANHSIEKASLLEP